jgi:hypothetical protein
MREGRRWRVSLTDRQLWTAIHGMVLGAIRVHILHYEVVEGEGRGP